MLRNEEWKKLEFNLKYMVSSFGRIKSINKYNGGNKTGILCTKKNKYGYLEIRFYMGERRKTFLVHRLILKAFKPIDHPELYQCNHINGIKDDNRVENLEWCTSKENCQHAIKTGLQICTEETRRKMSEARSGEKHGMYGRHHSKESKDKISKTKKEKKYIGENGSRHKLNNNEVKQIKTLLKEGKLLQREIAKMFDVCPSLISKIKIGVIWDHI